MHEIFFKLGGLSIHWYGVCAALGFLLAAAVLDWKHSYAGISRDNIIDIAIISMFAGVIGARVFYVIQFWGQFSGNLLEIFRIDKGGLVFYGGFILALSIIFLWCRIKHVHILKLLDIFGAAISLGHASGRIGCFMQGCCYGKPCGISWLGVVFPAGSSPARRYPADIWNAAVSQSVPLYPVQLFESFANIALCVILLLLLKTSAVKKPGRLAGIYLIGYGLLRSFTEIFRGDHTDFFFGVLTPAQTTAFFIMIPLGIIMILTAGKWGDNGSSGIKKQ